MSSTRPCQDQNPHRPHWHDGDRCLGWIEQQVRDAHAPVPDVDLASVRAPGGEPWANVDRVLAGSGSSGAAERRRVLEQHVRDDQRDQDALRIEAWAAGLSTESERLVAAAAAEVVRGRR